jgi:hypothetical protein
LMTPQARGALERADAYDRRIGELLEEIDDAERARRREWLVASRYGATYKEIRGATGYSDGMVCKEIRAARQEVGGDLAERLERRRVFEPA